MDVFSGHPKRRARAITLAMSMPYVEPKYSKKMPPTIIAGTLYFKGSMSVSELRIVLAERLLKIERFRTVLKQGGDGTIWLETLPKELLDMEYHVPDVSNGKVWTQRDIDSYLGDMYGKNIDAFDVSKPLWRWEVVPQMERGGSAIIVVVDHTVCDGIAGAAMLNAVLDPLLEKPMVGDKNAGNKQSVKNRTSGLSMSFARRLWAFSIGTMQGAFGPVLPGDKPNKLKDKDHRNPCHGKSCALAEHIPLQSFKDVKEKIPGGTINDVMLATLTLMLKRYFKEVGECSTSVSANFPINLRPANENIVEKSMGNNFIPGVFEFPMKETDPIKVLWAVKNQIDMIKISPAPLVLHKLAGAVVQLLNRLGLRSSLVDVALDSFGKVTVMLSNVPGPAQTRSLCSVPIDDMSFYTFTPLGVYLGVASYADRVSVGVVTGTDAEPDAQNLAKHWAPAFKELEDAVKIAKASELAKPADWLQFYMCLLLVPLIALIVRLFLCKVPA